MSQKKLNACILLLSMSLLCACSDYPTSGRLEFRPPQGGPIPTELDKVKFELSAVKGSIFEFDGAVVKALDSALDDLAPLKEDPANAKMDFASKYPGADFSALVTARQQLAQRRAQMEKDVARAVTQREQELASEAKNWRTRRNELQASAARFDTVTAEAQSEFDKAQGRLDEAKARHQDIVGRVLEATNKIILAERLPIPVMDAGRFNLSFETREWPQKTALDRIDCRRAGMWSYSVETHVIIDERATRRSCSYYRKPSRQLAGGQYEAAVRSAFEDIRALGIESIDKEVKQARQVLDNAAIVARNETGIDRGRINRELEQANSGLTRVELVQKHGLDAERILGFLGLSSTPAPPRNALAAELGLDPDAENRRIAAQLDSGAARWEASAGSDLYSLASQYEGELRNAVVRGFLVKETPINVTGDFTGLDGGAGLIVVVAQGDIAFEHERKGRHLEAGTWAELVDLSDKAARERAFPGGGVLVQGCNDCPFQSGRRLKEADDVLQRAVAAVNRHVNTARNQRGGNPG